MRRQLAEVYFVFQNRETSENHFLFKKNILRFRVQPNRAAPGTMFLQFIMRDGERIAFIITEERWKFFEAGLPSPEKIECLSNPVENYS